jgi:hypothetical protein
MESSRFFSIPIDDSEFENIPLDDIKSWKGKSDITINMGTDEKPTRCQKKWKWYDNEYSIVMIYIMILLIIVCFTLGAVNIYESKKAAAAARPSFPTHIPITRPSSSTTTPPRLKLSVSIEVPQPTPPKLGVITTLPPDNDDPSGNLIKWFFQSIDE